MSESMPACLCARPNFITNSVFHHHEALAKRASCFPLSKPVSNAVFVEGMLAGELYQLCCGLHILQAHRAGISVALVRADL
mmetsp:Transcript_103343/g.183086  ORF Transcript_103343/g.183086 Transcript_103343/m.183086 type:complete len:81 (+) Transcript_103343:162-404(+)